MSRANATLKPPTDRETKESKVRLGCIARIFYRLGASLVFALIAGAAFGQYTYHDLHDFEGTVTNANSLSGPDGFNPYSTVTFDASHNAYGTAYAGGANGDGLIWEVTAAGVYMDLHDFGGTVANADGPDGPDGINPYAGVSVDSSGNLYGTAYGGGASGWGMVWEITKAGVYEDLHDLGGSVTLSDGNRGTDGTGPYANITITKAGNLYGTASEGGGANNDGMVWEITSKGIYKDLHDFGGTVTNSNGLNGPDGIQPYAAVSFDSLGNIYGTTSRGGLYYNPLENAGGITWEITAAGGYKDLHDFGGTVTNADGSQGGDGNGMFCGVTIDSAGNLYGTATYNGPMGAGMVWEIESGGTYLDLHDFGGTIVLANGTSGSDGTAPYDYGNIVIDSLGHIFGTAYGGAIGWGMVWEIGSGGAYRDLHDFYSTVINANGTSGPDGANPMGGITLDSAGNLYGTAEQGGPYDSSGSNGGGNVWDMVQGPKISGITLSPTTIGGLGTTTATISLAAIAPLGGANISVHAGASGYLNIPSTVTVPAGATSATFTITGTAQRPSTLNIGIFASDVTSNVEALLEVQGDSLKSLTLNPSQIKWTSGTSTATLTISSAAPPGGWIVNLTPGVSGYVNMPASVTIPSGSTSTTFSITGNALRFFTLDLGITASDGGSKATATLVIAGDAVKSISLSPSTIGWGGTSTATVNLVVAAPPGGWLVNTNPGAKGYVTMPTSITVPAGATSGTFTIAAGAQRSSNLSLGIYANDGPSNQSTTLTIDGDSVKSLTLSPSTIGGAGTSTATVTLASAAPPGGWTLTLHAGASGYVTMPTSLNVPAGATTATFTITGTSQRDATVNLGIFASDGNTSQEAVLTLAGDAIKTLTLSPSSVAPGAGSTGTITLNSAAPSGGWVVKLTAGAPSLVTVPASVTVPAGATSATFAITTKAGAPAGGVGIIANDQVMNLESILTIT